MGRYVKGSLKLSKKKKKEALTKSSSFTYLDEETIESVANTEWETNPFVVDESELSPEEQVVARLTGPKTVEGKKRALQNLRPRSKKNSPAETGDFFKALMTKDEIAFYEQRREKYLRDFDLNDSSDEALLMAVLMEEINWYRLVKRQAEKPTANLDKQLNDCMKRLRESLRALGMTRDQRQGVNINIRANIADLVDRIERDFNSDQEWLKKLEEEEEKMLEEKKKREERMTIIDAEIVDADYEIVDKEGGGER